MLPKGVLVVLFYICFIDDSSSSVQGATASVPSQNRETGIRDETARMLLRLKMLSS
jgi:hypothetical protein